MVAVGRRELEQKLSEAGLKFRSTFSGRTEGVEIEMLGIFEDCILTVLHVAGREGGDLEHLDRGLSRCSVMFGCVFGLKRKGRKEGKSSRIEFGQPQLIKP